MAAPDGPGRTPGGRRPAAASEPPPPPCHHSSLRGFLPCCLSCAAPQIAPRSDSTTAGLAPRPRTRRAPSTGCWALQIKMTWKHDEGCVGGGKLRGHIPAIFLRHSATCIFRGHAPCLRLFHHTNVDLIIDLLVSNNPISSVTRTRVLVARTQHADMLLCANSSCSSQLPQRSRQRCSPQHHSVRLLPPAPAAQCSRPPVCRLAAVAQERSSSTADIAADTADTPGTTQFYRWPGRGGRRDHAIAYSTTGSGAVPLVLVHAFGTCRSSWAKLLHELDGTRYTAYAIDLLGFGDSDAPVGDEVLSAPPGSSSTGRSSSTDLGHLYSVETWASQLRDFVEDVVQQPAILVGNSAGALAALQAAVDAPQMTRGLVLLDCSLRWVVEWAAMGSGVA